MDIQLDDDRLRGAKVEETDWGYTLHGMGDTRAAKIAKGMSLGIGCAGIFTCVGLWVLPGSTFDRELLPLKLAVSVLLFLAGCALVQVARSAGRVEVQVDLTRRELRVIEREDGHTGALLAIWPFIELGGIDVVAGRCVVRDRANATLADLRIGKRRPMRGAMAEAQTA